LKRELFDVITQLFIGSIVVSLAIATTAGFIGIAARVLTKIGSWFADPPHAMKTTIALITVSLWLLGAITICCWMWAATFIALDLFATLEAALYFSTVTLTTLGYGDITLPVGWRLLAGICAANGLLLFGLTAAFLFELFARIHQAQSKNSPNN
jgi:hypothetical protein